MYQTGTRILKKNKSLTIVLYQSKDHSSESRAFLNCHALINSRWSHNILAAKKNTLSVAKCVN